MLKLVFQVFGRFWQKLVIYFGGTKCRNLINKVNFQINADDIRACTKRIVALRVFFFKKGGVIRGGVKSVEHRKSPIAEEGMEVPLTLTFSHEDQAILERMRECVTDQLALSRTATEESSDED